MLLAPQFQDIPGPGCVWMGGNLEQRRMRQPHRVPLMENVEEYRGPWRYEQVNGRALYQRANG